MSVVVDASALVALLIGDVADADVEQFDDDLVAPDLAVAEIGNGLRRAVLHGVISREVALVLLQDFLQMPIEIESSAELIERAFELLDNVSVPDACYLALAERLGCGVLTADARLARAPGIDVPFTVI